MREFFHSVKFKIILCIAALLLGLMTYVAVAAGTQTLPEQVISTVTYPFVTAANAISNGVNGFIDKWVNADTYKAQNDELRRACHADVRALRGLRGAPEGKQSSSGKCFSSARSTRTSFSLSRAA